MKGFEYNPSKEYVGFTVRDLFDMKRALTTCVRMEGIIYSQV